MLICRTLRLSKLLLQSVSAFHGKAPNLPLLNYERFFKEVQKAHEIQQAIGIYDSFVQNQEGHYQRYLTITMRILTRLAKNIDETQATLIEGFLGRTMDKIVSLDVSKLEMDSLKDVLFFFYKYSEALPSVKTQQHSQVVHSLLAQFLVRFDRADASTRMFWSPILFTNIHLAHVEGLSIQTPMIRHCISLLHSNQQALISNNLTFNNLLLKIRQMYDPEQPSHEELVHTIASLLATKSIKKLFDNHARTNILLAIIEIRLSRKKESPVQTSLILEGLEKDLEDMLLEEMTQINQMTFDALVSGLLKLKPDSRLLKEYYRIIDESIQPNGKAKVSPQILIWAVSLLDRAQLNQLLSKSWQQRFIMMLRAYYSKGNRFVRPISAQLLQLLQRQIFDHETNLELYEFYFTEYFSSKKETFISLLKLHIRQAEIHAVFRNRRQVQKLLGTIDSMLYRVAKYFVLGQKDVFLVNAKEISQVVEKAGGVDFPWTVSQTPINDLKMGFAEKQRLTFELQQQLQCLQLSISTYFDVPELASGLIQKLVRREYSKEDLQLIVKAILLKAQLSPVNSSTVFQGLEDRFNQKGLDLKGTIVRLVLSQACKQQNWHLNPKLEKAAQQLKEQYQGCFLDYQKLKSYLLAVYKRRPSRL